jgi:hypothetical protein
MKTKLGQLAEIRTGYTFRKPAKGTPVTPYLVIQIKDVRTDGKINAANLVTMNLPSVSERFFLEAGDILFCARGTRNQAAVFVGDVPEVVAGAQFFVIKVHGGKVLPEYLAWCINQQSAQKYLATCVHGTYISMIHKESLMELPIPVPSVAFQRKILAVHELALREQKLMDELKQLRAELVGELCGQAVEKS